MKNKTVPQKSIFTSQVYELFLTEAIVLKFVKGAVKQDIVTQLSCKTVWQDVPKLGRFGKSCIFHEGKAESCSECFHLM